MKVWPLPLGVDWQRLAWAEWERDKATGLAAGQTIKGKSVAIRLFFADAKSKGSAAEKAKINALMNEAGFKPTAR